MESMFIAGIAGFLVGGVLMFFMKDKITAFDASLHAKIDSLTGKVDAVPGQLVNVGQQLATHITQTAAAPPPAA